MIPTLYEPFRHWSEGGSIFILSDLHFDDEDCKLMDPDWISPEEQLAIINKTDPERITGVLAELEKTWRRYPDLRLGQLIVDIVPNESVRFNIEDDKMLDAIRAFGRPKGSDEE